MCAKGVWPGGKTFAFTVFDDTDLATLEKVAGVYAFLADQGFRTTKSCWPVAGDPDRGSFPGQTCEDPDYREWLLQLQERGFEIGWHGCTWHTADREQIRLGLDRLVELFGRPPDVGANHDSGAEGLYWGDSRLTGSRALFYNVLTRWRNANRFRGHLEGDEHFWGDLCREKIKYFRNFVFQDVNTLKACPWMPYHDPKRPYVNYWFASSNGKDVQRFNECLSKANQDRLEAEGGACIMYTHFASGFAEGGRIDPTFRRLMARLAKKNGWFVPVRTLLDYLLQCNGHHELTDAQRGRLERKWLWEKVFVGTV